FDDDHYYMGGIMAEKLRRDGHEVLLVTPAADVSNWTHHTLEQGRIQTRLLELGVEIAAHRNLAAAGDGEVELACVFTGRRRRRPCGTVVMVTARLPEDGLYHELTANREALAQAGIKSVTRIGDCLAPGTIAAAVYGGHRYARELDEPAVDGVPFRRELPRLADA
ncbi:MAG: NADH:flavin oxidoreductase, partial [Alphaproteobacteria bacterium]